MTATAVPRPLRIDYESEDFPADGPVPNGAFSLQTTWDELLWAAVTVGRPNRGYVFRHGDASMYEAIFRWSLTRMALEQGGPRAFRLRRTAAAISLDPSEKGAVSYFLGMTFSKLFADRLLSAPWMLHLDVFRPQLDPVLRRRSRPDLVGQTSSGSWVALESKGRISIPAAEAKTKAKQQALRLVSICGTAPAFHVGCIAFFRNDVLQFFWRDPEPDARQERIEVNVEDDAWGYYYRPVFEIVQSQPQYLKRMLHDEMLLPVEELDIQVGIHAAILELLVKAQWGHAKRTCHELARELEQGGFHADGIKIVAGPTWLERFSEFD